MRNPFARENKAIAKVNETTKAMQESGGMTAYRGDVQTSANDVQEWRAQDLFIAEHASTITAMQAHPWRIEPLSALYNWGGVSIARDLSPLVAGARLLSMMSNPVAVVGDSGSWSYVDVGSTRVRCATAERARELAEALNDRTFSALAPRRRQYIVLLQELTLGRDMPIVNDAAEEKKVVVCASPQLCVVYADEADAEAAAKELNDIYRAVVTLDLAAATKCLLEALQSAQSAQSAPT